MLKSIVALLLAAVQIGAAQIPQSEFAARRAAFAKKIDSGVVVAFGGRTLRAVRRPARTRSRDSSRPAFTLGNRIFGLSISDVIYTWRGHWSSS